MVGPGRGCLPERGGAGHLQADGIADSGDQPGRTVSRQDRRHRLAAQLVRHPGPGADPLLGQTPAATLVGEITVAELLDATRAQMEQWREYVDSATHPGFQAYAVLTACRALYTQEHAAIASKTESAKWVRRQLPHWSGLIDHALQLRALGGWNGEADHGETARFVNAVADRVSRSTHAADTE